MFESKLIFYYNDKPAMDENTWYAIYFKHDLSALSSISSRIGYRGGVDSLLEELKNAFYMFIRKWNIQLTVDAVVCKKIDGKTNILLIKRKNEPYRGSYALPGGFVEFGETVENAIVREVKEETNLVVAPKKVMYVASKIGRDPRGHTVSIIYLCDALTEDVKGGDDASEAVYVAIDKLPGLAFDHNEIIDKIFTDIFNV
ncbi:MAG: NUDIX hydrolase [Candidatus Thermoplasmatota archaeon]|jgi:8-oxo-dGTP diphosphatase|nr:NUDIX hydrolase [Candidatus Thermoplasmatota archaeon]MCL5963014.1 NUDIX hydrolase [Candidatus Thermoplasmatota archaeon]